MAEWQQKYPVDWDATDGRKWRNQANSVGNSAGDGEVEIPSRRRRSGRDLGAVALVPDWAKAFGRVSLPVVWAWATHFSFPRKILRVLWVLRAPEASAV